MLLIRRSTILHRGIADQLFEEDPELMVEFVSAIEIANVALVSWLIEEKEAENSCLPVESAESREFQLAVGKLKMTLAKLNNVSPGKGIPDGKA